MDPATPEALKKALTLQSAHIGRQDKDLQEITETLHSLSQHVSLLSQQTQYMQPPVSTPPEPPRFPYKEPHVPPPEPYSGDLGAYSQFILHCSLVFNLQPYSYPTERSKVALVTNLLRGKAASLSSGYHPQTNGQTERANQTLESALRCVAARNPSSWISFLPWIEYAHNSLTSYATGMSPFMACYSFQPPLFDLQEQAVAVPSVQDHLQRAQAVWKDVRAALNRSAARNKQLADRHRYPTPEYKVSLLKPVSTCALNPAAVPPPSPRIIDDHPAFTVLRILDVRPRGRGFQYMVDWEGYGPKEHSWISRKLILDPTLLDDFYAAHPGKAWQDARRRPLRGGYCHGLPCSTVLEPGWRFAPSRPLSPPPLSVSASPQATHLSPINPHHHLHLSLTFPGNPRQSIAASPSVFLTYVIPASPLFCPLPATCQHIQDHFHNLCSINCSSFYISLRLLLATCSISLSSYMAPEA
ncbi:uncharacterized protein LOC133488659 [Phyllopteryx taeniolatus]|uniref:uncharacterized protein LOC133488659 n=1 Tax=Phyllopteryx taeniolatus TaxID=161469 RepID=UPI002AD448DC|nr:uncharacterized protein LOC133488659 [Phyllopteryx taeniolatus]